MQTQAQTHTFTSQYMDLSTQKLVEIALQRQEGVLSANGSLVVTTGKRTGRSPNDKFIVKDETTSQTVEWGAINQPLTSEQFNTLWERTVEYLKNKEVFISNLQVGADKNYGLNVKVITETAWHNLFARHLFICPASATNIPTEQDWTLINAPGMITEPARDGTNSDAAVMLDITNKRVLICGMRFAGEMKKAMFTVLNFVLPAVDTLPMHCAANVGEAGDVTLFFGLSGTGKTSLSADPKRHLIGDDEHGWSPKGVFNFEGGCYAKCINLSHEAEPVIWEAIRNGAIMENVILDSNNNPVFSDDSLTQNTRAAYPLEHIAKRVPENAAGHPRAVIFLTCDLYGVLPPVALLSKEQAAYYFLSGYTALVGSTEMGSAPGVKSTFSVCFGAAFFPRPAQVYSELLMKRIEETDSQVYLVNTGWSGGSYGDGGSRFKIAITRSIVKAIVSGEIKNSPTEILPGFNLPIPRQVSDVDNKLLDPRKTWQGTKTYEEQSAELIAKFKANFERFNVAEKVRNAGPG